MDKNKHKEPENQACDIGMPMASNVNVAASSPTVDPLEKHRARRSHLNYVIGRGEALQEQKERLEAIQYHIENVIKDLKSEQFYYEECGQAEVYLKNATLWVKATLDRVASEKSELINQSNN